MQSPVVVAVVFAEREKGAEEKRREEGLSLRDIEEMAAKAAAAGLSSQQFLPLPIVRSTDQPATTV